MSTRNRGTQTQLKVGGIVLKLNSKNLSTTGFFFWENFLVPAPTQRVRKVNCSCLLSIECEEGCPKRRPYIAIVNHFHGVSSCFGFGGCQSYPCSIPVQGSEDNITSEKLEKGFCLCTLLSPQLSTALSRKTDVFSFRFLR